MGVGGSLRVGASLIVSDDTEIGSPTSASVVLGGDLEVGGPASVGTVVQVEGGRLVLEGPKATLRSRRSRGSASDPLPVEPGDRIGRVSWETSFNDGSSLSILESARIEGFVSGCESRGGVEEENGEDQVNETGGERTLCANVQFMTRSRGPDGVYVIANINKRDPDSQY